MKISFEVPEDLAQQLAGDRQDLSRVALEALAVDAYRKNRITGHQLRTLLSISSRYELDGFLKHHGVPLEYSSEDFEREADVTARLRQKRDEEERSDRSG